MLGVGVADHAIAPLDQLRDVLIRYVEQLGQHANGEVRCHLRDEVELLLAERGVQRVRGQAAQEGLVHGKGARSEVVLKQLAQGPVTFSIAVEHRLANLDLARVQLLQRGGTDLT